MRYLDYTFSTPCHNVACDEALLNWCDARGEALVRFWEPRDDFVVLGRSRRARDDVALEACHRLRVPIIRRCSGGGTVLQGPGCLNIALVLPIASAPGLRTIQQTNAFILQRHAQALEPLLGTAVTLHGDTDLALGERKFSGNAQRRTRRSVLFHGTFLLAINLDRMEQLLPMPTRQPLYRRQRTHREFLTTLPLPAQAIMQSLKHAWDATEALDDIPSDRVDALVEAKYDTDRWTFKH